MKIKGTAAVLILVLMEKGGSKIKKGDRGRKEGVLILVLMEKGGSAT